MIAQLPMYDWPEVYDHTDALWSAVGARLRDAGVAAPAWLNREVELRECWRSPDLLLGQTCGLPILDDLSDRVLVIGQFDYEHPGCRAGEYRSVVVARRDTVSLDELRGSTVAFNSTDSQSGFGALLDLVASFDTPEPFFGAILETEGHRNSVLALAEGRADAAAIDVLSWRLARRHEPEAARELVELAWTRPTPSPPLITSAVNGDLVAHLRECVASGLASLSQETRSALGFFGFVAASAVEYEALRTIRSAGPTSLV